jgi:hypothetical protein
MTLDYNSRDEKEVIENSVESALYDGHASFRSKYTAISVPLS